MSKHHPLPIERNHWRLRWLVLQSWNRLHRISSIEWDDAEDMIHGNGVAVCGARGRWAMPGMFSRLGLPRCAHCCDILGISRGRGCPENSLTPMGGE